MFQADTRFDNAITFSRLDENHILSSCFDHELYLEQKRWLSMEHYFQIQIAGSHKQVKEIERRDALQAHYYAKPWYRIKRRGWRALRRVLMTRAAYTKAQMYPDVKDYLLQTQERLMVESSQYDYYWGLGRDQRGENMFGRVWMDVRTKLQEEAVLSPSPTP